MLQRHGAAEESPFVAGLMRRGSVKDEFKGHKEV
jgi:hypothetical protein